MTNKGGIPGAQIRSFIERAERLNNEIKATQEDRKELFAEAKSMGFDVKVLKHILKERTWEKSDLAEFYALVDVYKHALEFKDTPLGQAASAKDAAEKDTSDGQIIN